MQFADQMLELQKHLESLGWFVYTPELSERSAGYTALAISEKTKMKKQFIYNHFEKIKKSDAILVANYDKKGIQGCIGSNTLMEIAVASYS